MSIHKHLPSLPVFSASCHFFHCPKLLILFGKHCSKSCLSNQGNCPMPIGKMYPVTLQLWGPSCSPAKSFDKLPVHPVTYDRSCVIFLYVLHFSSFQIYVQFLSLVPYFMSLTQLILLLPLGTMASCLVLLQPGFISSTSTTRYRSQFIQS